MWRVLIDRHLHIQPSYSPCPFAYVGPTVLPESWMCLISGRGWFPTGRKQERVRHPRSTSPQGEPTSSTEHPAVKSLHIHTGSVLASGLTASCEVPCKDKTLQEPSRSRISTPYSSNPEMYYPRYCTQGTTCSVGVWR